MDRYALIIKLAFLLLLCSYADENSNSIAFLQDKTSKKIQLNEGQKLLSAARKRMRNKKNKPPKAISTSKADLTRIKKLAKMYQKLGYPETEIKEFLQIQPEQFKNNAELSQLYSETLFRIMEKEPNKFVKSTLKITDVRRKMMDRYLKSPIGDHVNLAKVHDRLQKEIQLQWQAYEPKLKSNNKEVLTREYNKYESFHRIFRKNNKRLREPSKLILLKKTESLRGTTRNPKPLQERRSDTIPK